LNLGISVKIDRLLSRYRRDLFLRGVRVVPPESFAVVAATILAKRFTIEPLRACWG